MISLLWYHYIIVWYHYKWFVSLLWYNIITDHGITHFFYPQLHPLPLVIPRCVETGTPTSENVMPVRCSLAWVRQKHHQSVWDANLGHTHELTSIKSNFEFGHQSAKKNIMSDLTIPRGFSSMFKIIATNKQHLQQTAPEFDRGWHWTLQAIGRNENPDWHRVGVWWSPESQ